MNKEHPNIGILKKFNPVNPNTLAGVLSEEFVLHYWNPKLPELAGDYLGLSGLTDFFQKITVRTSGSFKVNPISISPLGDELIITHVKDRLSPSKLLPLCKRYYDPSHALLDTITQLMKD